MFTTETNNTVLAAVFSLSISAVLFATAVVPASPSLFA
ncbi:enoyl-CoA hydratase [Erythrobacter sp. F6033]|nr:enoyl-CoA hydratase [Erythrobacter sp. F6033]MCK0127403.1 enoyl-CoA hydratase [Erythrobacter sp. F6033]